MKNTFINFTLAPSFPPLVWAAKGSPVRPDELIHSGPPPATVQNAKKTKQRGHMQYFILVNHYLFSRLLLNFGSSSPPSLGNSSMPQYNVIWLRVLQ